jgi:hypothetical protein
VAVKLPARFSPQLCTAAQMQNTAAGGAGETNTQQHIHGTNLPAIFRQFSAIFGKANTRKIFQTAL